MDPTPNILQRLLASYNFGTGGDRSEKDQCSLITEVIDEILRANASRAVSREPPLSFRESRERWKDAAEKRSSQAGYRQRHDGDRQGNNNRDTRGKPDNKVPGKFSGRSGQMARNRVLKHNGNLVCFQYNRATGCNRLQQAQENRRM